MKELITELARLFAYEPQRLDSGDRPRVFFSGRLGEGETIHSTAHIGSGIFDVSEIVATVERCGGDKDKALVLLNAGDPPEADGSLTPAELEAALSFDRKRKSS
jgi:hypothetical protein